jgi:hypothetical protein
VQFRWSLCEEAHEPLYVLSRGRQQELLADVPETPQPDAAEPDALLEFGK